MHDNYQIALDSLVASTRVNIFTGKILKLIAKLVGNWLLFNIRK
jgi:hypothetical protein